MALALRLGKRLLPGQHLPEMPFSRRHPWANLFTIGATALPSPALRAGCLTHHPRPTMTILVTGQIVFLECRQTRLYAEVIQVLESRQMGWLRPLALVSAARVDPLGSALPPGDTDLNRPVTPDMLWPLSQLQPALDTDIMPLLTSLTGKAGTEDPATQPLDHERLTVNEFVQQLWAKHRADSEARNQETY